MNISRGSCDVETGGWRIYFADIKRFHVKRQSECLEAEYLTTNGAVLVWVQLWRFVYQQTS